tara:strand:- start:679 stop:1110 length:432 start_codon:yes stop_codon:yes gene_type:complete
MDLNHRQEAFAKEVVINGGDKVKARLAAGYSAGMNSASQGVDADKLYNHPKISIRIAQLQKEAIKIAKEKFSISIEQRLRWLSEIRSAGMSSYSDQLGNERRENLNASNAAIKTMNDILGVDDSGDGVKPVKVIIGVKDASRK